LAAKNDNGMNVLHVAAQAVNREVVNVLLDADADINSRTGTGDTALHLAARCGHIKMVEFLLSITARNEHDDTSLHLPARHGMVEVVKVLVECLRTKADITLNKDEMTQLDLATQVGSAEIVQILLLARWRLRVDIAAKDGAGKTALEVAEERGGPEVLKVLKDWR
jgi:ankyrin repeat protein